MADPREPVPEGVPRLDFVVPGFGKCGTTSLCAMLALHPQVFIPAAKELWFFSLPNYRDGWHYFSGHFRGARAGQLLGDCSAGAYLAHVEGEAAARALARHYPDCRILIAARDPVEKLLSGYRELHHSGHRFGLEPPFSLEQAIAEHPRLIADALYWERSAPYRELFAPAQIKVLFFEDMLTDPMMVLRDCFIHLGLDPAEARIPESGLHMNTGEDKLRDTRLLRWLRKRAGIGEWLAARDEAVRERGLRALGLRRPIESSGLPERPREDMRRRLGEDARRFLAHFGKPPDFWAGVAP
jgi:Sulfotransferase family